MDYLRKIDYQTPDFVEMYDELPLWSAPFGLMMLQRVPIARGISILDLGAGTGFMAVELAQRCGPDATVIAVDPWEAAMIRLRRKLDILGIRNVRTLVLDAATIDLPNESIDLLISNLGVNNFEKPDGVLRTCFRVAKPGARFLLTSNLQGHMSQFYDVFRSVLIESGLSSRLLELDAHIHHRATVEFLKAQLARAGFEILDVDSGVFQERFADGSALLRHYRIRSSFLQSWKAVVPAEAEEKVFTLLERRLNEFAAAHGELSLTIPMACVECKKPLAIG